MPNEIVVSDSSWSFYKDITERRRNVMNLLLLVGLVLGAIANLANEHAIVGARKVTAAPQRTSGLNLSIITPKHKLERSEQLKLVVMLINSGNEDIHVLGTMEWGYSASLIFHIRDASGKEIEPLDFPDDQSLVSLDDKSAFVKLRPNHFLGTNFFAPLDVLNLHKPGRYAVFVEYHSPLSAADVELKPFFGKERGTVRSNVVWIEVVR
jgi:hypothetical protein